MKIVWRISVSSLKPTYKEQQVLDKVCKVTRQSQEKKSEDLSKRSCLFCSQIHNLVDCPAFAKIPVRERFDFVMKQRLCFSCLRGGHQSRDPTRRSRLHIVTEDMLRWCILILLKTRTSSRHLRMRVFHSFHVSCYRGVYEFQKAPVTHAVSNIVSLRLSISFFLWVPWAHEHHLKYLLIFSWRY